MLATEMLFPDQVVVLGRRPLFVPYVDPGLALARRVRDDLEAHVARHGEPPKVIYLGNHGLFALGLTPEHVLQITAMAVKASRVLAGALAVGGRQRIWRKQRRTGSTRGRTSTTGARRSPAPERGRRAMPEAGREGRGRHRREHRDRARGGAGAAAARRGGGDRRALARARRRGRGRARALQPAWSRTSPAPRTSRGSSTGRSRRTAASTSWWRTRASTSAATSGRATPRRSTACSPRTSTASSARSGPSSRTCSSAARATSS